MSDSPLIDAPELVRGLAGSSPPVVLDVRWSLTGPSGVEEYAAGHIAGAVYVDLDTELAAPRGADTGRHPLPAIDDLQAAARSWGVEEGRAVVVYDAVGGTSAARAWWLLRWGGVADVRVLDGGLAAWVADGGDLTLDAVSPEPGDVVLTPGNMPTLDADDAGELARNGVLLDARSAERFRGENEPIDPVAGHIPGATSAPTTENLDASGRFLSPDALRERFTALGVNAERPVGAYCGSGVTAAHEILALDVIGVPAALYAGSWSEWITDHERPVATVRG